MVAAGGRSASALAAGAVATALAGCTLITDSFLTNEFSGDPFPVDVDTTTGAIVVGVQRDGQPPVTAVIDLLSPITIRDLEPNIMPSLTYEPLTLLRKRAGAEPDLARARFPEVQLVAIHPCEASSCSVGTPEARIEFASIVGADALAGDNIRLRLGSDQLYVLPDVGGDTRARTLACDAVFTSPYRGGGTLVLAGTELPFGNRRITMQACLGQDFDPAIVAGTMPNQRGTNVLLVVSTSIGVSILGEAAYQRYRLGDPSAPPPDQLPSATVHMPSGPVTGGRVVIPRLALVAAPTSNALAPCRQIYAHRLLAAQTIDETQCIQNNPAGTIDCPCKLGDAFCPVPAVLELGQLVPELVGQPAAPGAIEVLVVDDGEPMLQALRTELRPDQPEVDGILGTGALRSAEIDVDYPHDRVVARCTDPQRCKTRPQLAQLEDRCQINRCMYTGELGNAGCDLAR